jgi:hypothetical protein
MKIQPYDYPTAKLMLFQAKPATTLFDIILKSQDLLVFALK